MGGGVIRILGWLIGNCGFGSSVGIAMDSDSASVLVGSERVHDEVANVGKGGGKPGEGGRKADTGTGDEQFVEVADGVTGNGYSKGALFVAKGVPII